MSLLLPTQRRLRCALAELFRVLALWPSCMWAPSKNIADFVKLREASKEPMLSIWENIPQKMNSKLSKCYTAGSKMKWTTPKTSFRPQEATSQ